MKKDDCTYSWSFVLCFSLGSCSYCRNMTLFDSERSARLNRDFIFHEENDPLPSQRELRTCGGSSPPHLHANVSTISHTILKVFPTPLSSLSRNTDGFKQEHPMSRVLFMRPLFISAESGIPQVEVEISAMGTRSVLYLCIRLYAFFAMLYTVHLHLTNGAFMIY